MSMGFRGHNNVSNPGNGEHGWIQFTCAHCGTVAAGAICADYRPRRGGPTQFIICPNCERGSAKNGSTISPSSRFGPEIQGLPDDVLEAYSEARDCMSVEAFTAAMLVCRKILMHVAVDKGAEEGRPFVNYVDYLQAEGYLTPPMRPWVDKIRQQGNVATHRIPTLDRKRAEGIIMFTAELLRLTYEMDYEVQRYAPTDQSTSS